jgi:hypothetical protein
MCLESLYNKRQVTSPFKHKDRFSFVVRISSGYFDKEPRGRTGKPDIHSR